MDKPTLALLLAALAPGAFAASSADLNLSGTITPSACAPQLSNGGLIDQADLANYRIELREPIRGSYRGYEIIGPPPPSSSGVHITQMINIL